MNVFDNVWLYRGGTYTDLTDTAITDMATALVADDKLYFGMSDWLSGILFFITGSANLSDYVVELYDGAAWKRATPELVFQNLQSDFTWDTGYVFQSDGAVYWGKGREPELTKSSARFPEATAPPDAVSRYWYRITFPTAGGITLNKAFPLMFNTYTTPSEIAEFLGLPEFDDTTSPPISYVRKSIHEEEDFIDHYVRRSWRMRYTVAETAEFNPYGFRPRNHPPIMVTRLGLWNGNTFDVMTYGRGEQYFFDAPKQMVYFTLPSFRLRFYSFLLTRYIRQPGSVVYDYLWGADFDTDPQAQEIAGITKQLVAADLIRNNDETGILRSGLDVMSKSEKHQAMHDDAMERLDTLRQVYATGLGAGGW